MAKPHGRITEHLETLGQQAATSEFEHRQHPMTQAAGWLEELERYTSEHPLRVLLAALGLGALLAWAFRSR